MSDTNAAGYPLASLFCNPRPGITRGGQEGRARRAMKELWRAVFVTVLFLAVLAFLTVEKTSYIWTLRAIGDPNISLTTGYSTMLVLLVCPYLLALIQGLWNVSFLARCQDQALPPLHNILLGVLSSVLEAACVVWFTCLVAPSLPVFIVLPAMSGVLPLSSVAPWLASPHGGDRMTGMCSSDKGRQEARCGRGRQLLAVLCSLGPPAAALVLCVSGTLHWLSSLVLAGSLLLLAVMWSPGVLFRTFSVDGEVTHNCRRLGVMYTLIKIFAVFFFVGVDLVAFSPAHNSLLSVIADFFRHFRDLGGQSLLLPLLMNVVSSVASHGLTFLALTFCQPLLGMLVPSLLSTVSAMALCVGILGPHIYHVDELTHFGPLLPMLLSGGILGAVWAASYALRALDALHKPAYLFMPYEDLLLDYAWCAGFSDQRRLLTYCGEGSSPQDALEQTEKAKKSRVYVCTTMYREADYEMERLLLSLQRLSGGEALQDVYLEAHIFMDNGINGSKLSEFAEQLVGLMVSRLGMDPAESRCLTTPFGLQLTTFLPGGMPLFVHLKDPAKVKPKKRWSQCMYINYIMNFRKALWTQDEGSPNLQLARRGDANVYYIDDRGCSQDGGAAFHSSKHKVGGVGYPTLSTFTPRFCMPPAATVVSLDEVTPSASDNSSDSGSLRVSPEETILPETGDIIVDQVPNGAQSDLIMNTEKELDSREGLRRNNTMYEFKFDQEEAVNDDHTYILATDADMDFEPEAVAELLRMCNSDRRLGAACGRTHPIGKHCSSIVWHQIFEYAKDFWMIKSAQNVIGSVMCCPGCFSLYRASAIRQVMDKYATPTRTPFTVYVKDTGEDRWMATLMMINGWRLRYSAFADNTTYCPDTCQEFFKQRRRWILSDIANLILVVQNMPRLLRNNQCFSLVYVLYLLNMFMNNVITPGTAIVMITAGMDLVFDVPYIYTTPPLAVVVYIYAFVCTRYSSQVQSGMTSVLTVVLGATFASVAVWGSYKIVDGMISEIGDGQFHFQQHYIILMLTVSLLYAALVHPRECHQIAYGLAYLFIFPAMHLLLPIYSIANIIDQSWGTRDTQRAKIPKLKCVPNLKKLMKWRKKKIPMALREDSNLDIQQMVTSIARPMQDGSAQELKENAFWEELRHRLLGNDVNIGLQRVELAEQLEQLRNRSLLGLMMINAVWLGVLSYFYVGVDSPLARLNLYGLISGALYGFTLVIQLIGMTICRVQHVLLMMARYLYGDTIPAWIWLKEKTR